MSSDHSVGQDAILSYDHFRGRHHQPWLAPEDENGLNVRQDGILSYGCFQSSITKVGGTQTIWKKSTSRKS